MSDGTPDQELDNITYARFDTEGYDPPTVFRRAADWLEDVHDDYTLLGMNFELKDEATLVTVLELFVE